MSSVQTVNGSGYQQYYTYPLNAAQKYGSALKRYIESVYSSSSENQISRIRKVVKTSLEIASAAIVAGARGGMVMACVTGAGYILNKPVTSPVALSLGVISSTAVVVSLGAMSAFTMLKIINNITRKVPEEEAALVSAEMSKCKRTAIISASIAAGLVAQIPLAYVFYQSAFALPMMFSIFQLLDSGRTAYSINETLTTFFKAKEQVSSENPTEKGVEESRDELVKKLKNFRKALADPSSDREQLVDSLTYQEAAVYSELPEESEVNQGMLREKFNCNDFINSISSEGVPQIKGPAPLSKGVDRSIDVFALIVSGVVLSKFWQLGGQASDSVTKDLANWKRVVCYYVTASVVTLANTHLWVSLVNKCAKLMANVCRGAAGHSITEQLHNRAYKIFTYGGFVAACLTFVPQLYFSELAFDDPRAYYPIGALSSIGTALGGAASIFALRDILLARFTKDKNGKRALEVDEHLEKLIGILPKVKLKEFAEFLLTLTPETREKLKSPEDVDLQAYVESFSNAQT